MRGYSDSKPTGDEVDRVGLGRAAKRRVAALMARLSFEYGITIKESALVVAAVACDEETKSRARGCVTCEENGW